MLFGAMPATVYTHGKDHRDRFMLNRDWRQPDGLLFRLWQVAVLTALATVLLLAPWVAEAQGVNSAPTFGESGLLVYVNDTGSTATTYTDSDATTPGERYTYRVKALRGDQEGTHSNYARVDLPQPTPPTTTTLEPTPLPQEHEDSGSDYEAEINASERLTVGSVRTVSITPAGDEDWFEITLDTTKSYSIQLTDPSRYDGRVYPRLMGIRNSEGNLILGTTEGVGWFDEGPTTHHILDPLATGKYYIVVGLHQPDNWSFWGLAITGDYQIEVVEVETDNVAGDLSTAATLTVGQTRDLVAELPGDRDWFRVGLLHGHTYRVEALGSRSGSDFPSLYGVRDSDGVRLPDTIEHSVKYSSHPVARIRQFFTVPADGDYYIDLGAYPETTGDFWLTLYDDTDDFPDDTTTTGTVQIDGSVTGNIETPGDRDWFRTTMETGKEYRIDQNTKRTAAHLAMTPRLDGIYDVVGNKIDGTRVLGGGRLYFRPPNDGTYYISARGHSTGEYVLAVREVPVDLPDDTSTAGSVADARPVRGEVNQGHEKDWYRLDAVVGQRYQIDLVSPGTWDHGTCDPYLVGVYDTFGDLIPGTRHDNIHGHQSLKHDALDARSHFTAEADGAHYVSVSGHCSGTYFLMAYEEKDDLPADTTTTGVVEVGGALSGRIQSNDDQDWIGVALTEGQSYTVRLRGRWENSPPHGTISYLYLGGIHDSDGNYIDGTARGESSGVYLPKINFTAPATGVFYIEVGSPPYYHGTYLLDIRDVTKTQASLNRPATGAPTITGVGRVGQTLMSNTSGIEDADGMQHATFSYQWLANDGNGDQDIPGATDASYTLVDGDAGKMVKVQVTFMDDSAYVETVTSAGKMVGPPNNPATGAPTIKGTAEVGETLTADTSGIEDADGLSDAVFSYQWVISSGTASGDIPGATDSTYTPVGSDVGIAIMVRVSFTDDAGNGESLTSAATGAVSFAVQPQIANSAATGIPIISGDPQVGETLTADSSGIADADGLTNASYSYQWISNDGSSDTDITGATDSSYTVTAAAEGRTIRVSVTFTDDAGTEESLSSAATALVQPRPAPDGPPDAPNRQEGTAVFVGGVDLEWNDVFGAESYDVRQYRSGQWTDLPGDGVEIAFYGAGAIISGLDPESSLWFQVRAANAHGVSDWSEMLYTGSTSQYKLGRQARPDNVPASGAPVMHGTAQVGESLWVDTTGIEDGNGLDRVQFQYQWTSNDGDADTDIAGATDSGYTLVAADVGKTIRVRVAFTDRGGYSETRTSVATGAVSPAVQQQTAINPATWAEPAITGAAQVGEKLQADTSGITDDDGLTNSTFNYQWVANDGGTDADISGETDSAYTLVADDVGKTIKVRVTFTDDAGNEEALTSAATDEVGFAVQQQGASNTQATGEPTINAAAQVGETLTADTSGIADADGLTNVSYSYQWVAGGTDIGGATGSTYTVTASEQGETIQVRVSFTDDAGNQESLTSAATEAVAAKPNTSATGLPTIGGTAQVGETLTADTTGIGDADGLTNVFYSYQWVAGGTDLGGATGSTYALTAGEQGKTIRVRVNFTDDAGNQETLTSAATDEVAAKPNSPATGQPIISGTVRVGDMLTADTSGIADADGLDNVSYRYQWVRNDGSSDTDITDATASAYTLVDADEGQTLKVRVTFTDDVGHDETLTSASTAAVAAEDPQSQEPPAKPTGLTATVSHDSVSLTWDDPGDESITGYQILRRDRALHAIGEFLVHVDDTGNANTTFTDNDVEPSVQYVYRIKAKNNAGLSELSEWVRANMPAPTRDPNSPATGVPTVTGTAQVGEVLTADTSGIADADGLENATFSYQWIRNDGSTETDIQDATGSIYTLVDADEGQTIKVKVSFTDDAGNEETLTSTATGSVAARPNTSATGRPTISGPARVGDTLTADTTGIADADGLTNVSYSYQWVAGGTDLGGATGSTYTLTASEQGQTIQVRVSFTDDAGNETTLTSAATEAVAARPNTSATGRPTISGPARVGETLTVDTSGIADADGLDNVSYRYQWVVTDRGAYFDISGETGATYTLVAADRGLYIQVRVSFTDDAGKRETLTSALTDVVAAAP